MSTANEPPAGANGPLVSGERAWPQRAEDAITVRSDSVPSASSLTAITAQPPAADEQPVGPDVFNFSSPGEVAPIRQIAQNAIASQVRRGQIVLFFVGGLQLAVVGHIAKMNQWAMQNPAQLSNDPLVSFTFGLGVLLGILFLAAGFWVRLDPLLAPAVGLGIYLTANLFDAVLLFGFGMTLLPAGLCLWLPRFFIVVLLIDAIRAGMAYRQIVNRLIVETRRESTVKQ